MPHYIFNAFDGEQEHESFTVDLQDAKEARTAAVLTLAHSLRDDPDRVFRYSETTVKVSDESGAVVAAVSVIAK